MFCSHFKYFYHRTMSNGGVRVFVGKMSQIRISLASLDCASHTVFSSAVYGLLHMSIGFTQNAPSNSGCVFSVVSIFTLVLCLMVE